MIPAKGASGPPAAAVYLLAACLRAEDRDHRLGDFAEIFCHLARAQGLPAARRWYVRQVLKSLPALLKNSLYWGSIMLINYLKMSLRHIARHKLHAAINILGLAAGLTCCTLILMLIRYELSYDRYHENAREIFRVVQQQQGNTYQGTDWHNVTPPPLKLSLARDYPEILRAARVCRWPVMVRNQSRLVSEDRFFLADPEFLAMFTFPMLAGNAGTALKDPWEVLLTADAAARYFQGENPVGQTLNVGNQYDFKITGILQNPPANSHFHFDFIGSMASLYLMRRKDNMESWDNSCLQTYFQLKKGASAAGVETMLAVPRIGPRGKDFPKTFHVQPMTDIHLHGHLNFEIEPNGDIRQIYLLATIGFLIMLTACLNYMRLIR